MNVLAVAAHPDDEILGLGGVLARHVQDGDIVRVVIVGEGSTSRSDVDPGDLSALLESSVAAAKILGYEAPIHLGLPDNRLDSFDLLELVKKIEGIVIDIKPDVIYTHHRGDLNLDHRIVYDAVRIAARPLPGGGVKAMYTFETVSSTEWGAVTFEPNRYVDIGSFLDKKMNALDAYYEEMRPFPHPRSKQAIEALARMRGASVGLSAAEAFQTVFEIIK